MKPAFLSAFAFSALSMTLLLGMGGCAWLGGGQDDTPTPQANASSPHDTAAQETVQQDNSAQSQQTCGADRLDALIGSQLTQEVRQHIVDQSQAQQFRVLAPDTMQTMDYREDRLDIRVNEQGVIQAFGCG